MMFKKRENDEMNDSMLSDNEGEFGSDQKEERDIRIEALQTELEQTKDQLLRRTAEMDNMRRRHQQESMQLILEGNKRLILELLATIDDLERTLTFVKPDEKTPLTDGIELVYKNFQKILEKNNVKPFESIGHAFDVHLHDALMEEAREDVKPGTITNEIQKGYMMGDQVLRHAKVIVAKNGADE
ncbi:MAG: nucleotide exchange factor GrpE [Bacteroidota bacterium]|nr:nucleotide exchange factor GrpE [Bacteroidota bacterium]MDP4230969.1 nucleotide exchange factor GrpE [Bacteroidota bacterium]MDP4235174.1 nucleotide exchange factor GrpE [Bacteroidota bacterium]